MSNHKLEPLVYLVDDEYAVRDSLALLIESTGQIVKSFASAEAFLTHYNPEQPGCLLLDVRMPSMSGLELQDELLSREISIPIIFMSGHAGIPDSAKAFRAGAVDFLEKPFDNETLLMRIEEALNKDIASREHLNEHREIKKHLTHLTVREKEVLSLIFRGYSNKEMARLLDISNRTIEAHRASIMEKMQVKSLAELMLIVTHTEMLNDNLQKS